MKSLLPLLALVVFASGCVIYDRDDHRHGFHNPAPIPAELRVNWEFSGAFGCRDAGVTDILIEIDGAGEFQQFGFISCDLQYIDIPNDFPTATAFLPGQYYVTVLGFPPVGNHASWVAEGYIDLFGGFNEYTFRLRPVF